MRGILCQFAGQQIHEHAGQNLSRPFFVNKEGAFPALYHIDSTQRNQCFIAMQFGVANVGKT